MNSIYLQVGPHLYSLQSMFNGVLRGNRKGLDMLWPPFGVNDPRNKARPIHLSHPTTHPLQYMITGGEPLVHFGVNTFTMSSPPIRVYSSSNVIAELKDNARRTLLSSDDYFRVDSKKGVISLSELIFRSYAEDFGGEKAEDVIEWLLDLMVEKSDRRKQLMQIYKSGQYSTCYIPQNSDVNMLRGYHRP